MPTCEHCKARRKCLKWYSVEKWPSILVIHLKRFAPVGSYRAKLSHLVETPVKNLDVRLALKCHMKPSESARILKRQKPLNSLNYFFTKLADPTCQVDIGQSLRNPKGRRKWIKVMKMNTRKIMRLLKVKTPLVLE